MRWSLAGQGERVVPVVAVVAVVTVAALGRPSTTLLVGAGVLTVLAIAALRSSSPEEMVAGQLPPITAAVGLLAASGAGLGNGSAAGLGQQVVAMAAYPFLGRAVLALVRRHRQVRDADVIVEAALVATAVALVLQASTGEWPVGASRSTWGDAGGAFATVLVGLDVALLVLGARALVTVEARRGALGWVHLGIGALLVSHLAHQLDAPGSEPAAWMLVGPAVALVALGAAVLHPAARQEPKQLLEDLAPFSRAHAAVIVVALLAAPGALAVQAIRGFDPSATMATGAVVSGVILAAYLVQLLHDRASIEHEATHDSLTVLPNRTLLLDRLERSIAHARRNDRSVGLLFIDLDRFKEVNDTFGHAAGDELLQAVSARLQQCVRDEDTVARLSGDEFVVLLPHLEQADDVVPVADRLLTALGDPFVVAGERLLVAASAGIALYPQDGTEPEDILARADAAMYRAKESAGSQWEVYNSSLANEAHSRIQLESELLEGIARGELVLHYQPIVDAATGLTCGAEALVRWQHPERGLVPPDEFVPVAERSDLIVLLGEHVIREACRELRRWKELGLEHLTISVNVAARHFDRELVSTIAAALRATGADPTRLIVELTESTIVDNVASVVSVLEELRALGVRAAIDDFGTGYCGLQYLSVLPVATLKIDRSFIQGMTPSDAAIVGATIAMGHSLGLRITAEGVETEEQRQFLVGQGCDRLQGYLLGRPAPAEEIVARLHAERRDLPRLHLLAQRQGGDDDSSPPELVYAAD